MMAAQSHGCSECPRVALKSGYVQVISVLPELKKSLLRQCVGVSTPA